ISYEFNKYILLTHIDLHQTLLHLAYGGYGDKYMPKVLTSNLNDYVEYNQFMNNFLANSLFSKINNQNSHIVKTDAQIYGNLFLIPMNEQRTCESLNIPTEFCPLMNTRKLLILLFLREWDKCRPKLEKVLGELADKAEDDNEKINIAMLLEINFVILPLYLIIADVIGPIEQAENIIK
ncbi:13279_t:CDS:2, partial [Gigaspora margarita]